VSTETALARAWLLEQGEDVAQQGKLRNEQLERWREATGGVAEAGQDAGADDALADAEPAAPSGRGRPAPGEEGRAQEQTPRAVTRARQPAATRVRSLFGAARKPKGKTGRRKPSKPAQPWVRTDRFIESMWSQLAWAARPIPPIQRILAAQSPMVGIVLQDAARDTFIDKVLQPAARMEDKLEGANAVIGTLFWTALITARGGVQMVETPAGPRPVISEDGGPVWDGRTRPMITGLRFSLMSWLRIGERHADQIIESADKLTELGNDADRLIAWIFSPTAPGQSASDVEDEARERGMNFTTGAAEDDTQEPEPERLPGSALIPATPMGSFAGFDAAAARAARGG
jgi:hypothetical protein